MRLEPFAIDLWRQDIADWLPKASLNRTLRNESFFGGLYQKVVVTNWRGRPIGRRHRAAADCAALSQASTSRNVLW
jgi:hypothetical protein